MNTARQATENMEYVRRLLEEKQAGFAPSVELAVSVIRQQHVQQRRIGAGQQRLPGQPRGHQLLDLLGAGVRAVDRTARA
jgi:hypothetical protein